MKVVSIIQYKKYGNSFGEYLQEKGIPQSPLYLRSKLPKEKFLSKKKIVTKEFSALIKLFCNIKRLRNAKIYATGGHYACMLIFRLLGKILGKDAHLYLHNFYLHNLGQNRYVQKVLRFLLHSHNITIIAQTPGEQIYYRNISPTISISFIPYCSDVQLPPPFDEKRGWH